MTSPSENITDASATVAAATWLQEDKVDDGPALPESDTPTNAAAVWANGVDKFLKQTSEVFDGNRVLAALSATTISTDDLSAAALRSDSLSITNAAGTSTQITSSVSVPLWVRPASAVSFFGNGSGSPANGYAKSDAGNFQWIAYAGGTADANRRWVTTFNSSENLVLNRRDSGGASVEDVINVEWSSGTVYMGGTVLYHNNANADFRLGSGGGNPLFRITKSDAGAASMLYGIIDTSSNNRRWIHQFNSGEGLSWGRYDGAGSVNLTPFALSYTTGEVEITRIRGRGTAVEDSDFSLSSGWGSTAAVNVTEASDIRGRIEVICGGTGIGANPTVTFTFADGTFSVAPCVLTTRGDVQSPVADWRVSSTATGSCTFTFMGTPVASRTYILNYFVIA